MTEVVYRLVSMLANLLMLELPLPPMPKNAPRLNELVIAVEVVKLGSFPRLVSPRAVPRCGYTLCGLFVVLSRLLTTGNRCDILADSEPPSCQHCKQYGFECTFFLPITETRFKKKKPEESVDNSDKDKPKDGSRDTQSPLAETKRDARVFGKSCALVMSIVPVYISF